MKGTLPAGSAPALLLLAVLVVAASVTAPGGGGEKSGGFAPSQVVLAPYDGRSPREPAGAEQRVLVELSRPALGERDDVRELAGEDESAYVRSLEREGASLRSALGARGVKLSDVVTFQRTWNGFAATVPSNDLAALSSLGVRAQPVRRFYPAASEPVRVKARLPAARAAPPPDQAPVAVLDTGADPRIPALRGRVAPGYDAFERDANPTAGADPRAPGRREATGTALAGLVAAAGERVLSIRVAGYGPAALEAHGTTDTLLSGLERAVDPNGDGAVDDAARVALVGVNAPYAGFGDSPEARAARGAGRLGTVVVAPAGNEGPARPPHGVVGSPGAARAAVAAGALSDRTPVPRVALQVGDEAVGGAAVLAGDSLPGGALRAAGPVGATDPARLRVQDRVAVVRAGDSPAAQAAAAAAAGARAVIVADPRRRPLALMPAGRVAAPVVGVTGAAAKAVLGAPSGVRVRFGAVGLGRASGASGSRPGEPVPFSSRGPALDGTPKPDVLAPGAALAPLPGGGTGVLGGTAVAAARVAVRAARLAREIPGLSAAGLRERFAATPAAGGAEPPPPVPLGPLRLERRRDAVVGVRFALGAFDRGDPLGAGARIEPAARLELELVDAAGTVRRRLTPPGGARDLLPAEYAYTLPRSALSELDPGTYAFRAVARAPGRPGTTRRRSQTFSR